jgi:major inositol transporter-like SP family MFS transporter
MSAPLFQADMASTRRRGRMVTINKFMISPVSYWPFAMNAIVDALIKDPHVWRRMLGVVVVRAAALFVGMFFLPDSPTSLAHDGRTGVS